MKTYLIINPFNENASHGIANYIANLILFLDQEGIDYDVFHNNKNLSRENFRLAVKEYVEKKYGYDEVLIEAPEVKASTLLLDSNYPVHVRLHTPGAIAQKYDGAKIDEQLFEEELQAINQATFVSAPSYGIIDELSDKIHRSDISVYKNPFNIQTGDTNVDKEYDVVFMARFQKLKGIEYLNTILEQLPKHMKVLVFGNNSDTFTFSKKIKCKIIVKNHIPGPERFDLLKESKHLLQLSKFENCSMVILEGLACHTIVHAWDVGGNKEIATNSVLKISPFGDTQYLVNQLLNSNYKSEDFESSLRDVYKDFKEGFFNIFYNHNQNYVPYFGINKQRDIFFKNEWRGAAIVDQKNTVSENQLYDNFGRRIFGFSISNEHIEEFWMPIIDKMQVDYRFVCVRPKGFMYKFNNPYPVDSDKYIQFDWMKYPNLLIEEIKAFKPHKIFFHNGLHPKYAAVLDRVRKAFPDIPIVYSELGWFPQKNHVYFDVKGVNGFSHISDQSFEDFCGTSKLDLPINKLHGHVVIVTQLENDTNLIVNSNRFKSMEKFVEYCLQHIPKTEEIIIKLHPLENDPERFERFKSERIQVLLDGDLTDLLKNSKAVIGVNSTVLLESLQYNTNVYFFGKGVISNKDVAIDCTDPKTQLSEVWTEDEFTSLQNKMMVVNAFKDRQIHLPSLHAYTIAELVTTKKFEPLTRSRAHYSNSDELQILQTALEQRNGKKTSLKALDIKNNDKIKGVKKEVKADNKKKASLSRKFRKFKRDPYAFFNDSNHGILKYLAIFFRNQRKNK